MTTPGVMNRVQFPVEEAGRLASANMPGMTVADEYHQKEVLGQYDESDHERARGLGFPDARAYQQYVNAHVAQHGILNPLRTEPGKDWGEPSDVLTNGYHRWAAARANGIPSVPLFRTSGTDQARDAAIGQSMKTPPDWKGDD